MTVASRVGRALTSRHETTRLTVRVHPRAARPRHLWDGGQLELWIRQPPVHGVANEAVIHEVARWLGVPLRSIRIVSGHTASTKILEVDTLVELPPRDGP